MKTKTKFKRMLSGILSFTTIATILPSFSVNAEGENEKYPYTMFAASCGEGSIIFNASNIGVNGNVAVNGTILSEGNVNINGDTTEEAGEDMIYIFNKIDEKYFSRNVDEYTEDYILEELNININVPTEIAGNAEFTGNININTALKAMEDITLNGEVKNTNDSVIFSKYGDIIIDSENVNLNGLIYSPFGDVVVTAKNLNLNNVVIIADSITLNCPSINANYNPNMAEFIGVTSEPLDIPYEEWKYLDDENENDIPDLFEDFDDWTKMVDTDKDGLPDSVEQSFGSNPLSTDSDGDGLDDYYEVFVSFTNLINSDTDGNGISDDMEDYDRDGLTTIEEYNIGTDPWVADTDEDTLFDGEEVNNYMTDPLKKDTDDDGLEDEDEINLGTDPNNPDTNENGILDGDECWEQTISLDIQEDDEKVSAITDVSVTFDCSGIMEKKVTIENTYNKDILSSNVVGMVGVPVNITSDVKFDSATITFTYDESLLNGTPEENLAILWYDEVNNEYVILDAETVVDTENNTVSYTTTHFSTYLVIDREIWYDCFRKRIDYRNAPGAAKKSYDIAFVVDVSGSMNDDRLSKAKTSLNTFIDAMYPNDNACLITFNDSGRVVSKYGSSQDDLKRAVTSLSSSGGTSTNNGLETGLNELIPNLSNNGNRLPLIILICDGDVQYNNKTIELIKEAIDNSVAIYTVNICDSSSVTLEKISTQTGGSSYVATTTDEIAEAIEQLQGKTVSSFDMTDTDGDGLYDVFEINGMRIQNGNIYYTNPYVADSDGDGINDFEEMGTFSNVFHSRSNPNLVDSDNDGYNDLEDPELFTKTKIKNFGTNGYFYEVEAEAYNRNQDLFNYSWYSFAGDMLFDLIKEKKLISKASIDIMMQDVNECPYTYLVSDEDWLSFCLYFNERVQTYGEVDIFLHYFRNKMNRAPKTLNEMINLISGSNVDDKWIMCCPKKGRYHMFGIDGSYNIKFISSNNTDNMYEAVYDKNGNLITENDDYGKNMGTYNYASSSTQSKLHDKFDVKTYEKWGNTSNDPKPIAGADKNNITKDKDPITNYDTDEYSAKQHYEEVCERIGISYKNLKQMEFSDACY